MTNEENVIRSVFSSYINDLKAYSTKPNRPTIKMLEDVRDKAIKALEQQPSEDCVSRTAEMNGCQYCKYKYRSDEDEPCIICSHNYTDKFKDDGTREANTDGYSD